MGRQEGVRPGIHDSRCRHSARPHAHAAPAGGAESDSEIPEDFILPKVPPGRASMRLPALKMRRKGNAFGYAHLCMCTVRINKISSGRLSSVTDSQSCEEEPGKGGGEGGAQASPLFPGKGAESQEGRMTNHTTSSQSLGYLQNPHCTLLAPSPQHPGARPLSVGGRGPLRYSEPLRFLALEHSSRAELTAFFPWKEERP